MASENQASPTSKPRSMLPRTLVVVLSSISDVPSTKPGRFSSTKFEKVFEDFKQCNKESISIQLQDAVDDIHLVGWISPFTLLIHGSTEDMDAIGNAWVGRMLKPPTGFIIKDFGEISEVKMKQISQSQFISICDTLCEIVKGLNESQIAATFESVVSRLCSSFDSVAIPPMAAIKRSLDLLVRELRLDCVNGSYHFKNTESNASTLSPREILSTATRAQKIEPQVPNKRAVLTKKITKAKNDTEKENLEGHFEIEVKKRIETRKFKNAENCESKRQEETELEKDNKKGRKLKNNVVKSSSLKVCKPNHCIPRRQYSYEELHSTHAKPKESKKQTNKRNSFLGKLSRLLKMESIEDEKLPNNDEPNDELNDNVCYDRWEKVVTDDRAKLLSKKVEVKLKHLGKRRERKNSKNRIKESNRIKERTVSPKLINKGRDSETLSRQTRKNVNSDKSGITRRRFHKHQRTKSSTNTNSRSRSPDWVNAEFVHNNKMSNKQQDGKCLQTREQEQQPDRYSLSSFSESSYSNLNHSDHSLSSESSVELVRKSFHYSEEDTSDAESTQEYQEDGASNFCSTQAICGDLELSSLSLNPINKYSSDTSTVNKKHIEKSSVTPGVNKNGPFDQDCLQNNLRGRNLVQLIGIL